MRAIPEREIKIACERFGIGLETWQRQERSFRLLRKVYAKRAAIRGQQPPSVPDWSQLFEDWPTENETDEYSYRDRAYMERCRGCSAWLATADRPRGPTLCTLLAISDLAFVPEVQWQRRADESVMTGRLGFALLVLACYRVVSL